MSNTKEPLAAVKALRQVNYERLQRELLEWQQIASRRSGARGLKARQHLIAMEEKVETAKLLCVLPFGLCKSTYSQYLMLTFDLLHRTEQTDSEIDPASVEQDVKAAIDMLEEIRFSLEVVRQCHAIEFSLWTLTRLDGHSRSGVEGSDSAPRPAESIEAIHVAFRRLAYSLRSSLCLDPADGHPSVR